MHDMLNVAHKKVLLVEDEFLIASELDQFFTAAGAQVLGPFSNLDSAADYVDEAEAAVLDVKIAGDLVYPIADRLMARRTPFCFYTGYDQHQLPARFNHAGFVSKPRDISVIANSLLVPPSTGAVIAQLPDLRAAAILLTRDRVVADRLVELTLETALTNITNSDYHSSVGDWLRTIMHALYRQEESDYLH
jgi:DNA-binding LytR/AlgR family response regulator